MQKSILLVAIMVMAMIFVCFGCGKKQVPVKGPCQILQTEFIENLQASRAFCVIQEGFPSSRGCTDNAAQLSETVRKMKAQGCKIPDHNQIPFEDVSVNGKVVEEYWKNIKFYQKFYDALEGN